MSDEDAKLLKYAGAMGHLFVAIVGEPGKRRVSCECNTLDDAKRLAKGGTHMVVYSTAGGNRKRWLSCFDADMNALGDQVRKENGWPEDR